MAHGRSLGAEFRTFLAALLATGLLTGCFLSRAGNEGPSGMDAGPPPPATDARVVTPDARVVTPDAQQPEDAAPPPGDTGPGIDGGELPPDGGAPVDAFVPPDAGPPCAPAPPRCDGAELVECTSTGETRSDCGALGCVEPGGEAQCQRLVPVNLSDDPSLDAVFHPGLGPLTLMGDLDTDLDARCTEFTQTDGPALCVIAGGDVTIGDLAPAGARALVVLAFGDLEVIGAIRASGASGPASGTGGNPGENAEDGAEGVQTDGAGGGGGCGKGGDGGLGEEGATGSGGGGARGGDHGGGFAGVPLVGGSPGGDAYDPQMTGQLRGGAGGGAVQLSARGVLRLAATARVNVSGGAGSGGLRYAGGAGGGGGGTVVLEGAAGVEVDGAARIYGGGGGGGGAGCRSGPGDPGEDGHASDLLSAAGGTSDGCGAGGGGGVSSPRDGTHGQQGYNGGGGGGGSGCLVVYSGDGNQPANVSEAMTSCRLMGAQASTVP